MNRKVLLVDDDMMLISSMRRCLGAQFELVTANSGPEALDVIRKQDKPFGVIVTDMRMPKMNGVDFIREARPLTPETSFMMLTGNQDADTAIRAVNEGEVKRYFSKPCDLEEITEAIEQTLQEKTLEEQKETGLNRMVQELAGYYTQILESVTPEQRKFAAAVSHRLESIAGKVEAELSWAGVLAPTLLPLSEDLAGWTYDSPPGFLKQVSASVRDIHAFGQVADLLEQASEAAPSTQEAAMLRCACVAAAAPVEGMSGDEIASGLRNALSEIDETLVGAAVQAVLVDCGLTAAEPVAV